MGDKVLCLCILVALVVSTQAQPACRAFKAFRTTASSGTLLDTILVVDDFPVFSVQVSRVSLFHPDAQNLQLSLAHQTGPDAELAAIALKATEGGSPDGAAAGPVYVPESSMAGTSAGQWVLRVTDATTGTVREPVTLMSWTLQLCSAAVTAAQGPAGTDGAAAAGGASAGDTQYQNSADAPQTQTTAGVARYQTAPLAVTNAAQPATAPAIAQPQTATPAAQPSQTTAAVTQSQAATTATDSQAAANGTPSGSSRGPGPLPGPPPPRQPQDMPVLPRVSLSISDKGVSFNLTRLNSTTAGINETQPAISVKFGRR